MVENEFIKQANAKHNNSYCYDQVNDINDCTKVIIKHISCGHVFPQTPNNHLRGKRCPKCFGTSLKTKNEFIEQANAKHNNAYNYDKVEYVNNGTEVIITHIICKTKFPQMPRDHLSGNGCPKCFGMPLKSKNEFIADSYNYDKVEYVNNGTKVIITHIICKTEFP